MTKATYLSLVRVPPRLWMRKQIQKYEKGTLNVHEDTSDTHDLDRVEQPRSVVAS